MAVRRSGSCSSRSASSSILAVGVRPNLRSHSKSSIFTECSKSSSGKAAASEGPRRTCVVRRGSERCENAAGGLFQHSASPFSPLQVGKAVRYNAVSMTTEATKDSKQYPLLRNLQFSPIKEREEQYIVLWAPTGLSKEKLVLPLNYFFIVQHFDGEHSLQEIGALYLKRFGEFLMPNKVDQLVSDLDEKIFLEGDRAEAAKQEARCEYRQSPLRKAAFAGRSYEADGQKLKQQIEGFFTSKEGPDFKPSENQGKKIKGLVAPTYDLKQAGPIYAWGYKE